MADKDAGRRYCFELVNTKNEADVYWFGAADNDEFDQWVNVLMSQCDQPLDMGDEKPNHHKSLILNQIQLLQQELTREAVSVYGKRHHTEEPHPSPRLENKS